MKNPISRSMPLKTEFLASCYNTPSETVRRLFYVVVRAGHLRSAPDYRIDRDNLPGHDLLLCLSGSGFVLSSNRRFRVEPNELAWISGYHPHAHWANPADPWELLWVRIDGRAIEETCNILSVLRFPVFAEIPVHSLRREFRRILRVMIRRPLAWMRCSTQRSQRFSRRYSKAARPNHWNRLAVFLKLRLMCARH